MTTKEQANDEELALLVPLFNRFRAAQYDLMLVWSVFVASHRLPKTAELEGIDGSTVVVKVPEEEPANEQHEHTWVCAGAQVGGGNDHEYSVRCECGATGRQYSEDFITDWPAGEEPVKENRILRTEVRYTPAPLSGVVDG